MKNKVLISISTAILLLVCIIYSINSIKTNVSASPANFIQDLNVYRKQLGLREVYDNPKLDLAAQNKVQEMFQTGKFAHVLPTDKYPKANGYIYQGLGELLANNFPVESSVLVAWENSPTHNSLMVKANYCEAGFYNETRTINGTEVSYEVLYLGDPMSGCEGVYGSHANDNVTITPPPPPVPSTSISTTTATPVPVVIASSSSVSTIITTVAVVSTPEPIPVVSSSISTPIAVPVVTSIISSSTATPEPLEKLILASSSSASTQVSDSLIGEVKPIPLILETSSSSSSESVTTSDNSKANDTQNNTVENTVNPEIFYSRLRNLFTTIFFNDQELFWKLLRITKF